MDTRLRQGLTALGLILASVMLLASPAQAHNQVARTAPADGELWTESVVTIEIETVENMLDLGGNTGGFAIVVRDQQGLYYGDGCVSVGQKLMSTEVALGEPGTYEVVYQLVSEDGHTISDRFSFPFAPSGNHQPALGAVNPPVCGEAAHSDEPTEDSPAVTPEDVAATEAQEPASMAPAPVAPGVGTLVAGAIGVVVAAVAIGWLMIRRKNRV